MGGLGSGGARPHSGPSPKTLAERVLAGSATQAERRQYAVELERAAQAEEARPKKVAPPAGLNRDARRVWDRLAPHALAAHTLTAATVDAFRELCELTVKRDRVSRRIDRDGWLVKVATATVAGRRRKGRGPVATRVRHPLLPDYHRMRDEVRLLLTRFKLAPLGRAMEFVEPLPDDPAVDPFEEFEKPLLSAGPAPDGDEDGEPGPTAH